MESPKLSYFVTTTGLYNRRLEPTRFRTRLPVVVGELFPLVDRVVGYDSLVTAAGWEGDRYVVHVA